MRTGHPESVGPAPIFLFGVLERSGTNFLSDLLCLHPSCRPAHPLDEDFLLFRADLLQEYARGTAAKWHPEWGQAEPWADRLLASLGRGVLEYLCDTVEPGPAVESRDPAPRILTKTPSVKNLPLFPDLFPGQPAVVLMRDGRAVVESGVRSFGFAQEEQTRKWAWAARVIEETVGTECSARSFDAASPFLLVRYEDLVTRPEKELRRIFEFTGLDPTLYDFDSVEALPIRGSSTFRGAGDDVNWKPVERSHDFDPLRRWSEWTPAQHDRFNWIGGPQLIAFGYEPVGRTAGLMHQLRNRLLDLGWRFRPPGRERRGRKAAP